MKILENYKYWGTKTNAYAFLIPFSEINYTYMKRLYEKKIMYS